ncbi:MAG: hypothetical protein EAZ97_13535 [Bacteroidetes bacterium]|nr:MAG: hypothetical protein EAZ97_13535 [Bacteroidota bacterium]
MKTFFSIIYLTFNANLNEKISIGLFMSNGQDTFFKVSNRKLNIVKELMPNSKFNVLKSYFKSLNQHILNANAEPKIEQTYSQNWINESYFSYLSRYSNNLVSFSEPTKIEIELNENSFKSIFNKYVFSFDDLTLQKNEDITKVKTKFYAQIKNRVNLNARISPDNFTELVSPIDINFIGKNGVIVAGQIIDFDKRQYFLENDLTKFISFTKVVDDSEKCKGKFFLIGQEPNKTEDKKNHTIWQRIRNSRWVDYVDLSEIGKVESYIVEKNVVPFFEKTL